MSLEFTHPLWLLALLPALAWVIALGWRTEAQLSPWRKVTALGLRVIVALALIGALAGARWLRPIEGLNVFFLLDQSESIPSQDQAAARTLINRYTERMAKNDRAGVIVFGADASIDRLPGQQLRLDRVEAVVNPSRTDISAAVQLATAAFPETGQKRIVLLSDGNENLGDAFNAALAALPLGVSLDIVPLGGGREGDLFVQRLQVPARLKVGQPFEAKIFIQSDRPRDAAVRLYRNDQFLGEQTVRLEPGKNLFTFPQALPEPGFYSYDVRVDAPDDTLPQNNRATAFTSVRGEPRVLILSSDPELDRPLASALQAARLQVALVGLDRLPNSLAEMDSYDAIVLCNVAAGDLGRQTMTLLESAVRDFGVGLVCVGGDQAFTAGAYRGTPLENLLPVSMELDSRKVLPNGALALVIDRSGSMAGEKLEMAKEAAIGALAALGDQDLVAVIAFDAAVHEVAPLQPAANRRAIMREVAGIDSAGGTAMYPPMLRAYEMLKNARATLKHCIVLTDGLSQPGDFEGLARAMAADRITISTVAVGADADERLLEGLASIGRGRFYVARQAGELPQIFIRETAVVLKTAILEEPFSPRLRSVSEPLRGIGDQLPPLLGYVATSEKPRAETPLLTHKGDPLLAHWQYGLGRAVAFTSDARAKWARSWLGWERYRQFWAQLAQWSLRRIENADLAAEVLMDKSDDLLTVEALDPQGNYRNFLDLQAIVISPRGERHTLRLEQTGPGFYQARFPTRDVGLYVVNLLEMRDGQPVARQTVGASVNFSPEFAAAGLNLGLLSRLADATGGRLLDPAQPERDNPFTHDRRRTYQPRDLWETLLKLAIILFVLDVAVRRIQLDREECL
ncbi:MAG: VWA domain-containing protein, partial [Verrucomicrobiales bacterium]|nr:VWA domain-containing protein [Verrucomicrobiales bacterium]